MPVCIECGKPVKITNWNVCNIFYLCDECVEKLTKEGRCIYCDKSFNHFRASEFEEHIKECKDKLGGKIWA